MLCIFHNADHDGKGSAAIVRSVYSDAEFMGLDHGWEIDYAKIETHDRVVICDIALPMEYMFELNKKLDLVWIDHHVSVITEYDKLMSEGGREPIKGLRSNDFAAIELTWKYFYPKRKTPEGIRLLALNDLYDLRDERVRPFEYAFQAHGINRPDDKIWEDVISGKLDIEDMVSEGRAILAWIRARNYRLVRTIAFESEMDGMKCLCANMPHGYSEFYDSYEGLEKYDFTVNFYMNNKNNWKATFYSNKANVDVSKIAARFGGGGHKGAAGALFVGKLPDFLDKKG